MAKTLLEIKDLTIQYRTQNGWLTAVSNASFTIKESEYFGLVGESGCGKSTIVKSLVGGLPDNARIPSGEIRFKGEKIQELSDSELNDKIRWEEISYIPQSSMNSLDPLQKISEQAIEIAHSHTDLTKEETLERLEDLFEVVGIPSSRMTDYPHQFSGGMEQRTIIALALLLDPALIVADEPTTALDVIMQDQVMKYFDEIKEQTGTSLLMVTHDISVIMETCERQAIMHSGQVCEVGPTSELYHSPRHPYSILLQEAFPDVRYPNRELEVIEGSPPETMGEVDYCTFVDRCPWAVEECHEHEPPLESVDKTNEEEAKPGQHKASCFRKEEAYDLYHLEQGGVYNE